MLSVISTLYNEEGMIVPAVHRIFSEMDASGIAYEVVMVNNGSEDRTGALLEELRTMHYPSLRVAHLAKNVGYGGGYYAGAKVAKGDVFAFFPPDGEVLIADLIAGYRKLVDEKLDMCKAQRIKRSGASWRKMASICYNCLLAVLFLLFVRDINGNKTITRQAYERIKLQRTDYLYDLEIVYKIVKGGYKWGSHPVVYHSRLGGHSKIRFRTVLTYLITIFKIRLFGFRQD